MIKTLKIFKKSLEILTFREKKVISSVHKFDEKPTRGFVLTLHL